MKTIEAIKVAIVVESVIEALAEVGNAVTLQDISDLQLALETAGDVSILDDNDYTAEVAMQREVLFTRLGVARAAFERAA